MTQPNQLVQAKTIALYLGVVGSTLPADLSAPGSGFFNVGLTNPESCRFRVSPEFERVFAHQSNYPVKILQTSDAAGMDVDLLQWNGANFKAVYGGGNITAISGTPNLYKFVPPSFGNRDELAAILDVIDGAKKYRFIAARVFNESEVELELNKNPEAKLPLRLSILGGDSTDAWYMVTNDAAFDPEPTP
ncbi:phage tail tube protein [Micromonospora aurantiaca (nom. illeg.)]|uniref:phage tail tube protein n=1 Tax=Micromonospora aurantiaca (nom. illeg.) TaxID=47850 RepID=UPI0011A1A2C5|nr:hypothetical protein [Micromonospora aurantiaca]MBC9000506.1 hypothetical protein [Micromonospora aurantiaca]